MGIGEEFVEVTGRVTDKYEDRLGERLPAGYTPPPYIDSMDPTGSWIVVAAVHFRVSGRLYGSVRVGDNVVLMADHICSGCTGCVIFDCPAL